VTSAADPDLGAVRGHANCVTRLRRRAIRRLT